MGKVVGKLVMDRKDPSLEGARFLIVEPFNHDESSAGKPLVAIDVARSGPGDTVYLVRGREASIPWLNPFCPVDACIVGIIDRVHVEAV